MDRLRLKRPRARIVEKMLEIGLIQDRREIYKKRAKKRGDQRGRGEIFQYIHINLTVKYDVCILPLLGKNILLTGWDITFC